MWTTHSSSNGGVITSGAHENRGSTQNRGQGCSKGCGVSIIERLWEVWVYIWAGGVKIEWL